MLTIQQEKFVTELIKGKSQREAYKTAYPISQKWKESSVDCNASKLMANTKVKQRYDELLLKVVAPDIEDIEAIRKTILETELAIASANLGDLFDVVTDEDGMLIQRAKSPDAMKRFDMRAVKSYRFDRNGHILLELYDKQPAIATLREMHDIANKQDKEAIEVVIRNAEDYCV